MSWSQYISGRCRPIERTIALKARSSAGAQDLECDLKITPSALLAREHATTTTCACECHFRMTTCVILWSQYTSLPFALLHLVGATRGDNCAECAELQG